MNSLGRNYEQIFILTNEKILKKRHIVFRKADSIVLLADANQSPSYSKAVLELVCNNTLHSLYEQKIKIILVLNWMKYSKAIHATSAWIKDYNIDNVFHIQNMQRDTERVVRFLTGNAIGVVLSGGFSLAWAQAGFLKYIEEKNIPIDFIAGTSSGAGVAASYLLSDNVDDLIENMMVISDAVDKTASLKSATWPVVALFDGKKATESVKKVFGRKHIEDLPIPYLAVSSNLNKESEILHRKGLIWKAVRCSSSAPVLLPPFIEKGDIIVDGGLLNNLPCDHVRSILGESATIIAFDLGLQNEDNHHYYFPPQLATADFIKNKLSSKRRYDTPPFFKTVMRSMMLGSTAKQHQNIKISDYYIAPDLSKFAMLEFNPEKIKQLIKIGYKEAKKVLKGWSKNTD